MGDAVLGLVIQQLGPAAPKWVSVRNASYPQIDSAGLTEKDAATKAAQIYERFGYWTTISSAVASWALVLDNGALARWIQPPARRPCKATC